ncbi:hypothetical protein R3P38DRAFT_3228945 [Favolaschia claudopus]|uniref:SWIM-type domain-containing protein n=1 Tax=Favolaschia claudopus TaxID=2862362 RepID=A0AAV9ZQM4_9AGAR
MLGIGVDGVIPTTNHLESFNGVFKRVNLGRWQKAIHILPSIFKERSLITEQASRIAALVRLLPGGAALLDKPNQIQTVTAVPKVACLISDPVRDERAREMVVNRQIGQPTSLPGNLGLVLEAYSSRALAVDTNATTYTIRLGFNGVVTCTCEDFKKQGGACKHIRGALMIVANLRWRGIHIPYIPIPPSFADAQALQSSMLKITIPPNQRNLPTAQAARQYPAEGDEEEEEDDDDDNASVATNASSDSDDSDSEFDDEDEDSEVSQ